MNEVKYNHVQLSKFLMKPFAHKTKDGKQVYYFDLKKRKILEEKINKLGTEPDYYYPETEFYLHKEVESKAGDVYMLLKSISKTMSPFQLTEEDTKNIQRLFAYSLLRGEGLKKETINKSIYLQLFSEKDQTALIIGTPQHVLKYFSNYFADILINKSFVDFVLPHSCMYPLSSVSKKSNIKIRYWCMPISPKCCVLLIPKEHLKIFMNGNIIRGLYIESDDELREYNDFAFEWENINGKKFIVGDKVELNRLLRNNKCFYKILKALSKKFMLLLNKMRKII